MVNCVINDKKLKVSEGTTILEAARQIGVDIPTLCHMKLDNFNYENKPSSCRICMVEVEGRPKLCTACSEEITEGMVIRTDTPRAVQARKINLELLLSNHPKDCLVCPKNLNCELQALAEKMGIREIAYKGERMQHHIDSSSNSIFRNPNKCVMCRRCETMCNEVQTVGTLSGLNRGFNAIVAPAFNIPLGESSCTFCGQCVAVCPTGALVEIDATQKVFDAIRNPKKHVVVQVAPAIRVALGELFNMEPGKVTTGKLVTALRKLGFDVIFDTDFSADLTVIEEASELVDRIKNNKTLPMLTSCCPAWVRFIEMNFPEMLDIPSTCKSPQIMMGTMVKTYYSNKTGIPAKDIVMVSIMPCTAKKAEAARDELGTKELRDVDYVLSTRELGRMIKLFGIDFNNLEEGNFDNLMGQSSGAGTIFGTTGGVIEAAVRTAGEWLSGQSLGKIEFQELRGLKGIREAEINIGDLNLKIGIAHGLGNARKLLEGIKSKKYKFDAIEIMACPGGCIGGGGQPYHHGHSEILLKRQEALYEIDRNKKIRKAHENPMIKEIYETYLGKPYGERAHELLHTTYVPREKI
ncbi:NADH-quinone oxidoreductase subunit G/NADP-reducing hydrogenase subunit HndD [Peptoniphilus koenoeneniae]|uniref:NADH-quinone oxidoreductase subunit G/NADP-reducing hydrogenase subunit HndD n=1 Tax=Peptoniphilus koenoeneniae TaxID=507751 RepID=A0ABU0AUQ5_9FIRM|nr:MULTISPECIES: NADH-dependent [FeFe] hydrogenase, group A6 [Peptoniphilus]ERT59328.1 [FeFe] hydrogenase, group A [Peptoniphilus sp. BV3C26]MDQ0274755.1 NADH-quinone oxidoreductase subunit G/NADP-reducing hydrogenase subunit HndD [Peptoniphilus koenoeneniae]